MYEPNKNRLFSQKFNGKNEINSNFLFFLLETFNTTGINLLFPHRTRKKDLIQNDYEKVYLFFKFFIDLRSKIRNCNKSVYDRIHRYLSEPTNDLHLMNKSLSYLTRGNNNFLKNTNNIKRNIINKNLLVWGKNKISNSYCDDTKRGRFIFGNFQIY